MPGTPKQDEDRTGASDPTTDTKHPLQGHESEDQSKKTDDGGTDQLRNAELRNAEKEYHGNAMLDDEEAETPTEDLTAEQQQLRAHYLARIQYLESLYANIPQNMMAIESDAQSGDDPDFHTREFTRIINLVQKGDFKEEKENQFYLDFALPTVTRALLQRGYTERQHIPRVQRFFQDVLELIIAQLKDKGKPIHNGMLQTLYRIFHIERKFYVYTRNCAPPKLEVDISEEWMESNKSTGFLYPQNVNYFGHFGGFEAILERLGSRSVKMTIAEVIAHIDPLVVARLYLAENFIATIAADLKNSVFRRISDLTELEVKSTEKSILLGAIGRVKELLRMILSSQEAAQITEVFELDVAFKLLNSQTLPRRIDGISHINLMIEKTYKSEHFRKHAHTMDSDDYEAETAAEWMNYKYLCKWLLAKDIVGQLYGETSHVQLATRGDEILTFLAKMGMLKERHIDVLWNHAKCKHEAEVSSIYSTVARIGRQLTDPQVEYLFSKVKEIPCKSVGSLEVKLVYDLARFADYKSSSASVVYNLGLAYLWRLVQDDQGAETAVVVEAIDKMTVLLQKQRTNPFRKIYLRNCLINLQAQRSIVQSLRMSKGILQILTLKHSQEYTYSVIEDVEKKFSVLSSSLKTLKTYCGDAYKTLTDVKSLQNQVDKENGRLGGKYSHELELKCRMDFISYILGSAALKLSKEQVIIMWDALIGKAVNREVRDQCLEWLRQLDSHSSFDDEALSAVFERLTTLDFKALTMPGLLCFCQYLIRTNELNGQVDVDEKESPLSVVVNTAKPLDGISHLWDICLQVEDEEVCNEACIFLIRLHQQLAPSLTLKVASIREGFVTNCMEQVRRAANAVGLGVRKPKNYDKHQQKSDVEATSYCTAILRCLRLLDKFRQECKEEDVASPYRQRFSEYRSLQSPREAFVHRVQSTDEIDEAQIVTIPVLAAKVDQKGHQQQFRVEIDVRAGVSVAELRAAICQKLKISDQETSQVQLKTDDETLLSDFDVVDPIKFQKFAFLKLLRPHMDPPEMEKQSSVDRLKMQPSFIISNKQEYFDLLFDLLGLHRVCLTASAPVLGSITQSVWNLLTMLPTNQRLLHGLRNFSLTNQSGTEFHGIPEAKGNSENRAKFWKELLDTHSPAKLLYSLRIIQRLMRANIHSREKMVQAREWRKRFIDRGGFAYLIKLLHSRLISFDKEKPDFPQQAQMRQGCLALLLRICNFFIVLAFAKKDRLFYSYIPDFLDENIRKLDPSDTEDIVRKLNDGIDISYSDSLEPEKLLQQLMAVIMTLVEKHNIPCHGSIKDKKESIVEPVLRMYLIMSFGHAPSVQRRVSEHAEALIVKGLLHSKQKRLRNLLKSLLLDLFNNSKQQLQTKKHQLLGEKKRKYTDDAKIRTRLMLHEAILKLMIQRLCLAAKFHRNSDCYFKLLHSILLEELKVDLQSAGPRFQNLFVKIRQILQDFESIESSDSNIDFSLSGLLHIARILVDSFRSSKCIDKLLPNPKQNAQALVDILMQILFKLPTVAISQGNPDPQAKSCESRTAAFDLIVSLTKCHRGIYLYVCKRTFLQMDNNTIRYSDLWKYSWFEHRKSAVGYVGLYNMGCICYMNSLLQQFHMVPEFRKQVLSLECHDKDKQDSFLYQLQTVFGNLQESRRMSYSPFGFVRAFKDYEGNPTDPRVQQDVNEFFNLFCQRLEYCAGLKSKRLLMNTFGGILEQQIIIEGAKNRYRDEPFYALSLDVKGKRSIEESLDMYVQGEQLTGKNQYKSEELGRKVDALRRVVIKKLPNLLILHLKRFEFNFDEMKKVKLNDYCSFEETLNMRKYTKEFLDRQDQNEGKETCRENELPPGYYDYELHGLLIHTGSADHGHYYSYIKERVPVQGTECRWLEFDDTIVKPFDPQGIPGKCYGGMQTSTQRNKMGRQVTRRIPRAANAYLLFYERVYREPPVASPCPSEATSPTRSRHTKGASMNSGEFPLPPDSPKPSEDCLPPLDVDEVENPGSTGSSKNEILREVADQLAEEDSTMLNRLGSKRDEKLMQGIMPAKINDQVFHSNMLFLRNRYLFDDEFHTFVTKLVGEQNPIPLEDYIDPAKCEDDICTIQLASRYILEVLARRKKNEKFLRNWVEFLRKMLSVNVPGCRWLMDRLCKELVMLRMLILECHVRSTRESVYLLISSAMKVLAPHERPRYHNKAMENPEFKTPQSQAGKSIHESLIIRLFYILFQFLTGDVVCRCWRNFDQYFRLLVTFASLGRAERSFIIESTMPWRLVDFYLGNDSPFAQQRRWEMGDEYADPQFKHFWELMMIITRVIKTDSRKANPPTQLDRPISILDEVRNFLLERKFLERMLKNFQNTNATYVIVMHWTWENEDNNRYFCDIFQKCICDTNYDAVDPLYDLLERVLKISDSLQDERVEMYLNPKDGLIEKAFRFRLLYPLFTYGCIKKLLQLAGETNTVASRYLNSVRTSLEWTKSWLVRHIENKFESLSDATPDTVMERQHSAMETLHNVSTWLSEDENEGMYIGSPVDQGIANEQQDETKYHSENRGNE